MKKKDEACAEPFEGLEEEDDVYKQQKQEDQEQYANEEFEHPAPH